MTYTYDLATTVGQLRLLIHDTVEASANFSDEELTAYLTLNGDSLLYAAAQALDNLAIVAAATGKVTLPDLTIDGSAQAKALIDMAKALRAQADSGDSEADVAFDWAEMVTPFNARERIVDQVLRGVV
jgi:hypothetical protein